MTPVLEWLESTWLSTTLRDSPNVFLYPTILAFHTLGLAFFVGISSAIALRILGVGRIVPLAPLKKFYPELGNASLWCCTELTSRSIIDTAVGHVADSERSVRSAKEETPEEVAR